ncbi:D-alanine--D-alanine ligase domain protein [Desulfovibrio sp. X2]|uniref:D-alanine--D-alanine ligase family protein n=1 Tax=Desulfovibrio sp. X2 TaxID=941449 RepID=UPI00035879AF|nr:hypothetical protein [Desulfovibrio sp. X2]EPR43665.1 D-alanine--D-alanine ligase domain protein [Desulfovibrio sp. X2]
MKIGITYDLKEVYLQEGYSPEEVAEFDCPETVQGIEEALWALGCDTDPVGNVRELVRRLALGERWDMVFNIAEGLSGFGRESQVPALLEAYRIPCTFSDPLVLSLCLHKGMTKHVLRDRRVPTPAFAVVERPEDAARVDLAYPLFAKPVAEGTSKGVSARSLCRTPAELAEVCAELLDAFRQPVLVERYLPGREFTVGILGTGDHARSLGVMEVLLRDGAESGSYSLENKWNYEERVEYRLVDDLDAAASAGVALMAWRAMGCRDGGRVDVRLDEHGQAQVIELNPLPGLNPSYSDLPILCRLAGMPYVDLIGGIVRSAAERSGLALPDARASRPLRPVRPLRRAAS